MIDTIASKLATSLKNANKNETPSVAVMKFALIITLNSSITIILSLSIGALFGKFTETAIVLCCFALLHFFSGGYHFKSAMACTFASIFTIVLIPLIPITKDVAYILMLCSLILILIYAPSNISNAARLPEKYFPFLKLISIVIVLGTVFLSLELLALTYFIQSLTLITLKKRR